MLAQGLHNGSYDTIDPGYPMQRLTRILPIGRADRNVRHGSRRASERFPLNAHVEVTDPGHSSGIVINASAGGLRVAVDQPVGVGQVCRARVCTSPERESVETARVVWSRELPDGWVLGLEFVAPH